MKLHIVFILPLVIAAVAIKVPVDYKDEVKQDNKEIAPTHISHVEDIPIYYVQEQANVDSYLIPPDPHKPEQVLPDTVVTPATYLLPPAINQEPANYYAPTESGEQSEWYPLPQAPKEQQFKLLPLSVPVQIYNNSESHEYIKHHRGGKAIPVQVPSINLEPPAENAPNDFIINVPSIELELPSEEIDEQYRPYGLYSDEIVHSELQPITPHLFPPKRQYKHKNPTKLYPKKFHGAFKPIPIPIAQYAQEISSEVPKARPAKYFQPPAGIEGPIFTPADEKRFYQLQQAEKKKKLKQESQEITVEPNYGEVSPTEQVGSESNFRYPGHNVYAPLPVPAPAAPAPHAPAAPLKQKAAPSQQAAQTAPPPDDRTEFRMHGMKGPHSYQFGYDTGKGKNRQFRFEERDNDGLVRGHYGYMDKFGKLRVVNYRAHPEYGFQAEPQEEQKEEQKEEQREE